MRNPDLFKPRSNTFALCAASLPPLGLGDEVTDAGPPAFWIRPFSKRISSACSLMTPLTRESSLSWAAAAVCHRRELAIELGLCRRLPFAALSLKPLKANLGGVM